MKFTNKELAKMIIPLFLEQLLVLLVGIIDTFMVSYAGEAAVSGVSLVNSFSNIFIVLFTALSSGGAVIISQYIGRKDQAHANEASGQLLMFSFLFSLVITIIVFIGNEGMLRALFGHVDADVMAACVTYLWISALSYPFLGIYNAGASVFRSIGNTRITMIISIFANLINIAGNYIGVFILHAGVAGVAWPTFASRVFQAVMITILAYRTKSVRYENRYIFHWNGEMLKRIFNIAVPNGLEQGIFQFVKVALSSIIALFGTYQIAANGVAQSIWSLAALSGVAMSPVFVTVIGQCMGAGDVDAAEYYFKKLLRITLFFSIAWSLVTYAATPLMLRYYQLADQTKDLVLQLVLIHNIFNAFVSPFAASLGSGLRAAGDVKYTMVVSIAATIGVRLVLSYILGVRFNMGVIGIAWAMCANWCVSAACYLVRFKAGTWQRFSLI